MILNMLIKRYFNLAQKYQRCHVGSGISALKIIDDIYKQKKPNDIFILSCGHASLAWYVILEKYLGIDAEELLKLYRIHPNRDMSRGIFCSSGSLGHGLGIAIGAALANRDIHVYCLISDGECSEGSIFEGLRIIKEQKINNIKVHVNLNGFSAYEILDSDYYEKILAAFLPANQLAIHKTDFYNLSFLNGVEAHYHRVTKEDLAQVYEKFIC